MLDELFLWTVNQIEGWKIGMIPKDVKVTGFQDPLAILAAFLGEARGILIARGARIPTF